MRASLKARMPVVHDRDHLHERQHVVEAEAVRVDGAARRGGVGGGHLVGRQQSRREVGAGAPERRRAPGEVLERIAEVHHLPVEHAGQVRGAVAVRLDQEVAEAVVAVHERRLVAARHVRAQPEDGGRDRRVGRKAAPFEAGLPARELARRGGASRSGVAEETRGRDDASRRRAARRARARPRVRAWRARGR